MRHEIQSRVFYRILGVFVILLWHIKPSFADDDVARLLYQTTFGPTPTLINQVEKVGKTKWINQQILLTPTYHQPLYNTPFSKGDQANRENAWYQIAMTADDQLRQRMAYALSQIVVVSQYGGSLSGKAAGLANYYDMLVKNAFGNYKDLLYDVTTHPVMGNYLSMMGSAKADSDTGALPDENFAREVMQLFTLGLYQLNIDGSKILDDATGKPMPTYTQNDVQELARALTGWVKSDNDFVTPMTAVAELHDSGEKTILGSTIPAGLTAQEELSRVIDIFMSHPNMAPFISKRLIQRFVTSNPSPGYISRVAKVFNNNGKGKKGDLSAVIKAVLLDAEARGRTDTKPIKVKEPILVLTNFHRAAGFSLNGTRFDAAVTAFNTANQGPLRSPSVFNFYSPNYQPSNAFMDENMVSPEYQILNWAVYTELVNYMLNSTRRGGDDTYSLDFDEFYAQLDNHKALVNLVDQHFFAGTASETLKQTMLDVLDDYKTNYVPTTKLSLVIFAAISDDEFYIQD